MAAEQDSDDRLEKMDGFSRGNEEKLAFINAKLWGKEGGKKEKQHLDMSVCTWRLAAGSGILPAASVVARH